jgi:hypothetical protein
MPPQLVALTEGPNILLDKPIRLSAGIRSATFASIRAGIAAALLHAQVGECLVVRDLGSTNGVRINGSASRKVVCSRAMN